MDAGLNGAKLLKHRARPPAASITGVWPRCWVDVGSLLRSAARWSRP